MSDYLDLYDYRCRVAAIYRERNRAMVAGEDPVLVLQRFREERDRLFASHPQSALDTAQKRHFRGLRYFPYNPAMRFIVDIDTGIEPRSRVVAMNAEESMTMTSIGQVSFTVDGKLAVLSIYWLNIYGGGLFLPFRDATCPQESYGGGRYLFDTMKGSDPVPIAGEQGWNRIALDFNYAYNPSCAYNARWVCPLAPAENVVGVAIRAGEMNYLGE
jgi:uncharacterized protein (DUF1684 family)